MNRTPISMPGHERGIATILIIILLGLSMSVALFKLSGLVRSTQEQGLTQHTSALQSQPKGWAGVDLVRQYFFDLNMTDKTNSTSVLISKVKDAGTTSVPITMIGSGITGLSATVIDCIDTTTSSACTAASADYYLTVNLTAQTNTGSRAQATSTIEAVLQVTEGADPSPNITDDVISFNDDLTLDSNVELINTTGVPLNINVSGDFYAKSNVIGFNKISSEGNITMESNPGDISELHANGDIRIDANLNKDVAASTKMFARGNICLYSNALPKEIVQANGFVYANIGDDGTGTDPFTEVIAANASDWAGNQICGDVTGDAVSINQDSTSITVPSGESVDAPGANVNNDPIVPVPPVSIGSSVFDANLYKTFANYAIKRVSGTTKVEVKYVNGISDGEYFLRNTNRLCTADNDSTCLAGFELCGSSVSKCFEYDSGDNSFLLEDVGSDLGSDELIKQGLIWMDGNLWLKGTGLYYNTFIATGNATIEGDHTIYAINYTGAYGTTVDSSGSEEDIRLDSNDYPGDTDPVRGVCPNTHANSKHYPVSASFYPTNFCKGLNGAGIVADNDGDSVIDSLDEFDEGFGGGIGNFSMTVGSVIPGSPPGYQGGDISISGNVTQYGSLIAGNTVDASSNISIHGTLAGQSNRTPGVSHSLASNITITVNPSSTFTPGIVLTTGASSSSTTDVVLRWSRYR